MNLNDGTPTTDLSGELNSVRFPGYEAALRSQVSPFQILHPLRQKFDETVEIQAVVKNPSPKDPALVFPHIESRTRISKSETRNSIK